VEEKLILCLQIALELEGQKISLSDEFKEFPKWDSLAQISLIAGLDEAFGVEIEAADFKKLITVQDLLNEVAKRAAS
jgi:acyl carrier protein